MALLAGSVSLRLSKCGNMIVAGYNIIEIEAKSAFVGWKLGKMRFVSRDVIVAFHFAALALGNVI